VYIGRVLIREYNDIYAETIQFVAVERVPHLSLYIPLFFLADGDATIRGACRVPASTIESRELCRSHASATSRAATLYI
jgi:hypothetical protein